MIAPSRVFLPAGVLIILTWLIGGLPGVVLGAVAVLFSLVGCYRSIRAANRHAKAVIDGSRKQLSAAEKIRRLEKSIPSHAGAVRLGEDAALAQWYRDHPELKPKPVVPTDKNALRAEIERVWNQMDAGHYALSSEDQAHWDRLMAEWERADLRERLNARVESLTADARQLDASVERLHKRVMDKVQSDRAAHGAMILPDGPTVWPEPPPWPTMLIPGELEPARQVEPKMCQCFTCTRAGDYAVEHPGVVLELGDGWTDVTPMGSRHREWARTKPWRNQDPAEICRISFTDGTFMWRGWGNRA